MRSIIIILVSLLFCFSGSYAQKSARIISQPDSPVKITSYQADYQRGSTYQREGIQHEVKYQNISQKKIVAVQIGFVSFDIWNEFLDQTNGVSMDKVSPGEDESGTWIATVYSDFSFYTGIAYVSKVRFDTGEIWLVNIDTIAQELKKIEKDFNVANLKKKEGSK
jgi:hypothetical protein